MSDNKLEFILSSLRNDVSRRYGQRLQTSGDYEKLAQVIFQSKGEYISKSTLKRFWGYVKDHNSKRTATLDILARYLGYDDFNHYAVSLENGDSVDSDYNSALSLDVQKLDIGTKLLICWHPDRSLLLRYKGNLSFLIEESVKTRLTPGQEVRCMTLIKGMPLILNLLMTAKEEKSSVYIVGIQHGIDWKIL